MKDKTPVSFRIFIGVFVSAIIASFIAGLLAFLESDTAISIFLTLFLLAALVFTMSGAFKGFIFNSDNRKAKILNIIGIIGNCLIFIIVLAILIIGYMMTG